LSVNLRRSTCAARRIGLTIQGVIRDNRRPRYNSRPMQKYPIWLKAARDGSARWTFCRYRRGPRRPAGPGHSVPRENGITSAPRAPRTSCLARLRRRRAQPFLLAAICGIHTPRRPCQFPHRLLHAATASGGWAMTFEEILDQAIAILQRRGRLTYGTLKRQSQLDDAAPEDLTNELTKGQRLARDEDGAVLVWIGPAVPPLAPAPTPLPATAPTPLA